MSELIEANHELTKALAELAVANRDLDRSNADLEQLAYVVSHDLGEPLRAISGPLQLLAERYRGQLDDEADQLIAFAVDGSKRMREMINGLLAFSRIGRDETPLTPTDAGAAVSAALTDLSATLRDTHSEVTVDPLPTVLADRVQLVQVFQNLIGNAVKFVPAGVTPRVRVTALRTAGAWRFSVTDNGIGIPPQHRDRVFTMFKRMHARESYPGTGIGLALVKRIIEHHGGTIGMQDGPGGTGTSVWFTLPVDTGNRQAPADSGNADAARNLNATAIGVHESTAQRHEATARLIEEHAATQRDEVARRQTLERALDTWSRAVAARRRAELRRSHQSDNAANTRAP